TAIGARKRYVDLNDPILVLILLELHLYALLGLKRLNEASTLITEGDSIIESLTVKDPNSTRWLALFLHLKGNIHYEKGEWDAAFDYWQQSLSLRKKLGYQRETAESLINIGNFYFTKGNWEQAQDFCQRALTLNKTLNNNSETARNINLMGWIYHAKGEIDIALDYFQKGLTFAKASDNAGVVALSLNNIGTIHYMNGEVDMALDYRKQALSVIKANGSPQDIAHCLHVLGWTYLYKGETETALDYSQQALVIAETVGSPRDIAHYLTDVGWIYRVKGELDTALNYMKRALNILEVNHITTEKFYNLFLLLLATLDHQEPTQAHAYLTQLKQVSTYTQQIWTRVAEALVLKQSSRLIDKVQAQTILREILNSSANTNDFPGLVEINLCDLLLFEVKSTGDSEAWNEAKNLIQQLYIQAKDQQVFPQMVEALLLQAKFAAIDGKLQHALKAFDQARDIATEKHLGLLNQKTDKEQKKFENEFEKWQDLIKSNASLQERLEHAQMDDYIKEVQRKLALMKE
ncbi:MAG: tetratricopeptide repeat protein, partial [Candidatus Hodarchaeota archaeon]